MRYYDEHYDDSPPPIFQRAVYIKHTRKPHKCDDCGTIIPPNSSAIHRAYLTHTMQRPSFTYHHTLNAQCILIELYHKEHTAQ